jgi:hypothetical protein
MNDDFSEGDELTDEDLVRLAEFFMSDQVHTVGERRVWLCGTPRAPRQGPRPA